MTAQDPDVDDRADEIFVEYRRRLDAGESVDVDAVLAENADVAPALRERFDALHRLGRAFAHGESAPPSLAGRTIGPYRLDSVLGAGGMGTVYLATVEGRVPNVAPGVRVAVKVIHPHLLSREGFFKRFMREAEIGKRVVHPNVVRTLDCDSLDVQGSRIDFLAMEYVEGQTLRSLAEELTRLPEELCRHVGRAIARALAEVHAAGAIHRDVKPENVLITKDHVVRLMDLGVARLCDDEARLSQTGAFVGSVLYAAPEQFRTRDLEIDGRADLYALGLVLYELATGRHPFADDDVRVAMQRQLTERARPAGEVNPQLSPLFEELLAQLLEKDKSLRPNSAEDVARILDEGEESAWWRDRAKAIRVETRRPLRRIRIPRETALYGRDAELTKLGALFEKANAGEGQVLLVEGEAGIGKSRLIDEFAGLLHQQAREFNYLFGSYPPGGAATASGAFSTAYREHLGDDESAIRAALPVTPLLVPAFAALLRGDVTPTGAEPLTKDSLQTVFVHATRSFAAQRATIVLIDDLHFAPEEGRALFASLALAVPGHRILLVGTARPGIDEKWLANLDRVGATRLPLPRLSPKDLVRLLADSLRSERLAEELSGRIALKSDGNPFFVFEILRGLREGQFLTQRPDGTWVTTQILRDIQIPSSVRDLVNARVADLDAEERDLLDVAACVGFEFDPSLVAAALGAPLLPTLKRFGQIERKHRLVRSSGRHLVFDHHQVQEAIYEGLMEQIREHYHAALADALESRADCADKDPATLDGASCVDLCEHFLKGAQGVRAKRYLDAALTHLEKGYLNDAVIRLTERALAVPGLLAGKERAEVCLRRGGRLDILGRRKAERAALDEAKALADADGDPALRARVLRAFGTHLLRVSRLNEAESAFLSALVLARATGDRKEEAKATGRLGVVYCDLGRYPEARECHERSIALAQETGDRQGEADATGSLGVVLRLLGRVAESREHYERQLALARELGDRRGESIATANLGIVFLELGRYAEGREHFERQFATARESGDRWAEAIVTGNLGNMFDSLGRYAESREHFERYLALAREIDDRRGECAAILSLGNVCSSLGRLLQAREHYGRSVTLARETGDRRMEAVALVNLGSIHLYLGEPAPARRHLNESLALCRQIGLRKPEGYALHHLSEVEMADAEGDAGAALGLAEESLVSLRAIGDASGVADSLLAVAELRRRNGETESARSALEESLRLSREQGRVNEVAYALAMLACLPGGDAAAAVAALDEAGESEHAMPSRLLLWQATGDRVHLAAAKRLLDELLAKNPPEHHAAMLANVRVNREITAAAKEHGI